MQTDNEQKYTQTLEWLYNRLQAFHRVGAAAYKPGLHTTLNLCRAFGDPHKRLRTIHIAGTNGKGSTAHTLAAVLQLAGYKTGLYTSPHLMDFAERIRIDGQCIAHADVLDFTDRFKALPAYRDGSLDPSFFELATVMAFEYFERQHIDLAVIETGLGGRLDSTNVITPLVSVITNISLDHTALLGNTPAAIAAEKAGIIKPDVPAVIGEADRETRPVFTAAAEKAGAPLFFAQDRKWFPSYGPDGAGRIAYKDTPYGNITAALAGDGQQFNTATILQTVEVLRKYTDLRISDSAVRGGFEKVVELTGLAGRWQKLAEKPCIICDTGHNPGAWQYLGPQLSDLAAKGTLHIVLGFVSDKDISHIVPSLPVSARYYFVRPDTPRAADSTAVAAAAGAHGIKGTAFPPVKAGWEAARQTALAADTIFVGGSNFVVADFLKVFRPS